jgi:hypothetical protein
MGTDIHLLVEHAIRSESGSLSYFSLSDGPFSLTRDYRFFGALSEIRGGTPLVPSRGMPADASDAACRHYYQLVDEGQHHDGLWQHVVHSDADEYVTRGLSHRRTWRGLDLVSDPDAHTPSWLTRAELFASLTHAGLEHDSLAVDIRATLAAVNAIPYADAPRVVFWFDN